MSMKRAVSFVASANLCRAQIVLACFPSNASLLAIAESVVWRCPA